ncbi:MAG: hypothetical protein ACFNUI_09550 [Negativicutes bacterium]
MKKMAMAALVGAGVLLSGFYAGDSLGRLECGALTVAEAKEQASTVEEPI